MTMTIGLVANVFQEINALPGWLETHLPYFDDVRVTHAGPQFAKSTDGTIELLEKWGIPVDFDSIDDGFGAVRTRTIQRSPCDYVMLLDADERFYPIHRVLKCVGQGTPQSEVDWILQSYDFSGVNLPNWENLAKLGANLKVEFVRTYDQGAYLRDILEKYRPDAVATIRRHWHDLSMRRPTQDWREMPDWQMRLVRNGPDIFFSQDTRMHEQLMGANDVYRADVHHGPFMDHFHFTFKKMEPEQRRHDLLIYNAIHAGKQPPQALVQ